MARVVLLQRIVPSYRLAVLRRLAEELGWRIVFGRNVPGSNIGADVDATFLHGMDFRAWSAGGSWRSPTTWAARPASACRS